MRRTTPLALAAAAACLSSGCVTEERLTVPGQREQIVRAVDDDPQGDPTEERLLEAVDDEPESSRAWYALANYYERRYRFREALGAYQELQARIEVEERATGKVYTGGQLAIGRVLGRLGRHGEAAAVLEALLERQPQGVAPHPNFVEAHYLLGWIHLQRGDLDRAEWHLVTHKQLAPDSSRVDTLLIRVLDARRQRATVQGSFAPDSRGSGR